MKNIIGFSVSSALTLIGTLGLVKFAKKYFEAKGK